MSGLMFCVLIVCLVAGVFSSVVAEHNKSFYLGIFGCVMWQTVFAILLNTP